MSSRFVEVEFPYRRNVMALRTQPHGYGMMHSPTVTARKFAARSNPLLSFFEK